MWSVILRISLNNDAGSKILAKYKPLLTKCGFTQFGGNTGSWRIDSVNPIEAAQAITDTMNILANPLTNVTNVDSNASTDHVWIYVEQVK